MIKKEPLELADLAPRFEVVDLGRGESIKVFGATAKSILDMLTRFPVLGGIVIGRTFRPTDLVPLGPQILAAMVASVTANLRGCTEEEAGEKLRASELIAMGLSIDVQLKILEAGGRVTFTDGFGPFVRRIGAALAALSEEVSRDQATRSPRPSKPSAEQPIPASGT